jgi:hypothetical protein
MASEHSTTEANVDATLWVGGALSNTYLRLTGPDHLTTYVGSAAYPMQGYLDIDEHHSAIIPYPATKSRDGQVDPAFSGGTFRASQERSVTFTSVP